MGKIICYFDKRHTHGPLRFVTAYRPKSWFRRERIEESLEEKSAYEFSSDDEMGLVITYIEKKQEKNHVFAMERGEFRKRFGENRFWVICKYAENGSLCGYYSGTENHESVWSEEIYNANICMDEKTCAETANTIRKNGDKIAVHTIFLDLTNNLLNPIFIITCTTKTTKQTTKFFGSEGGKSLRLVGSSSIAHKFTYTEAMEMFEHLKTSYKNYLYAVIPDFGEEVRYTAINEYVNDHPVNRMVQMELKLNELDKSIHSAYEKRRM